LHYANFSDGDLVTAAQGEDGMIVADNSTLQLDHVNLMNPRRPGNSGFFKNSTITLNNSQVTDTEKFTNLWVPSYGLKIQGGEVVLTNNQFSNIQLGISADNSAVLHLVDMATSSFTNVDNLVQWSWWTGF
jgi:hypothetical protein